ncbi:mechanosensitive ion channel domain-containing protein [Phenylobacterium sp.]|jgi:small-conductance mechanosensitive channel|uniref:mechanosensitive ion channel family protein n=1 Tax=Phenylobacterium sp. TaxID=1871053 RepID=UPI000C8A6D32|nr:mechanosensitive ion channel domain-containing protein [Phenylobacterium sp.]MAK81991.1 transporter [Phenylobacterium sp.]|tara:strand:- start:6426 stop:7463 length:1038 start_codon:yes stop_codon:yes gene_type:complete
MQTDLERVEEFVLFTIGRTPVTLGGIIAGALVVVMAFVVAAAVAFALRRLRSRVRYGGSALYIVEKLVTYGVVIVGLVAGLSTVGLDFSSLAIFAGAVGVGVGLGLQGVVKEFVSGLVLIFDRVVNIGDYVELEDGHRGQVQEIGPRATRIRNNDNIDIIVPNSHLIEGTLVNWTLHGQTRRIHIPFSVAYGADKDRVRDAVLAASRALPFTMPESDTHKSQVWLVGFGDSALNFELLVWPDLNAAKRPNAMLAAYTWAIDDALRAADIEIPFPQTDLRIRSLFGHEGDKALDVLQLKTPSAPEPAKVAAPTTNDAAEDVTRPVVEVEPDAPTEGPSGAKTPPAS